MKVRNVASYFLSFSPTLNHAAYSPRPGLACQPAEETESARTKPRPTIMAQLRNREESPLSRDSSCNKPNESLKGASYKTPLPKWASMDLIKTHVSFTPRVYVTMIKSPLQPGLPGKTIKRIPKQIARWRRYKAPVIL